jgi:predicted flap endonuclease-1-like 5' DNA nuclease
VTWFVLQSLVPILVAFVVGLVVGWLWWRRRKVHFSESEAVRTVTTRLEGALGDKDKALSDKDAEIARLTALVPVEAGDLADAHRLALAEKDTALQSRDAQVSELSSAVEARDTEIARLSALISESETTCAQHRRDLADREASLSDRDNEIARLSAALNAATSVDDGAGVTTSPTDPDLADIPAQDVPEVRSFLAGSPATVPAQTGPVDHGEATADDATAATAGAPALVDLSQAESVAAGAAGEDDLERVEGIGPRIGAALRQAGIHTFRQLADADTATLQAALERAGLRFAPSLPTWSRQARLLADGDEEGFIALTDQLVAGRDVPGAK